MTVTTTGTVAGFVGNGVTLTFHYPYRVITAADVDVYLDGIITTGGYASTVIADGYGGLDVTFFAAPAVGVLIELRLGMDDVQLTDYTENNPFPAEVLETDLDYLTLLIQQTNASLNLNISSTLRVPIFEAPIQQLPTKAVRPGKLVTFDPNGQPIVAEFAFNVGAAAIVVTSIAMLRAAVVPSGAPSTIYAEVTGYYGSGDRGGGGFVWSAASLVADDAGYVIKPNALTSLQPGRWLRITPDEGINPRYFGALGDSAVNAPASDDSNAFQAALDRHKAVGGWVDVDTGVYNITRTMLYTTSGDANGLDIRGLGFGRSIILYNFGNGTSLFKCRNLVASHFMHGGGFTGLDIRGPLLGDNVTRKFGFFTQQAAIDISGWMNYSITKNAIQSTAGHAIWSPNRFVSVNNNTGVGVDFPNDKPWVYVAKAQADQRPSLLKARVDPATGAITGFQINRWGAGYADLAAITVTGCGTGFTGRIRTTLQFNANTTNGSQTITNVPASAMKRLVLGQRIDSGNTSTGATVGLVVAGTTSITISTPATATGLVTFAVYWEGGGIIDYIIDTPGSGYYEDYEHLFDNPDPFTTGLAQIRENYIVFNDGWAINLPHFSAPQHTITNNYMVVNASGGILLGLNHATVENNGIGINGLHPTAGWFPGIWLVRFTSSAQTVRISQNELESNPYAHILVDGTNGIEISRNRLNSSVTAITTQTNWDRQIPFAQIKFENGNNSVANTSFAITENCHRWQDAGAAVPVSSCNTVAGNPTITNVSISPLGGQVFIVGARVEILDGAGVPITLGGGVATETTIQSINLGAATMTLVLAPNVSLTPGIVRVKINQEAVLLYDFGRNSNSTTGRIRAPNLASNVSQLIKAANYRSQDTVGSLFDYTEGGFRVHGSPGLKGATMTMKAGQVMTVPATPGVATVTWDVALDPENLLEFIPQVPPTPSLYTGRYKVQMTGLYRIDGQFTIPSAAANDVFRLTGVLTWKSIDSAGVVTTNVSNSRQAVFVAAGLAQQSFQFNLSIPFVQLETYVGFDAPVQRPVINTTTGGDSGLVWWHPRLKAYYRWNGVVGVWEAVAGGPYTAPFDLDPWLYTTITSTRAAPINFDTSGSALNWCTFTRVG